MKRLFIILLCLVGLSAPAQTVGDSFSYIKEKESGTFYTSGNESYPYFYIVYLKEVDSEVVYFFNNNLICTHETIQPKTPDFAKVWIDSFNWKWKQLPENKWQYVKGDSTILICELHILENKHFSFDSDIYTFYIKGKE